MKRPGKSKGASWVVFIVFLIIWFAFRTSNKTDDVTAQAAISHLSWPTPLAEGELDELASDLTRKNYYVIFDASGSMQGEECSGKSAPTKEAAAKDAVKAFATQISPDANLGLLIFDQYSAKERVKLGIDNRQAFADEIEKSSSGGGTPLKSAIETGITKLGVEARKQQGYGEYHLVVITDGEASQGEEPGAVVNFALDSTPVNIHTIGFCVGLKHVLNQQGRTFYRAADDPRSLSQGLTEVLAESEEFDVSEFNN